MSGTTRRQRRLEVAERKRRQRQRLLVIGSAIILVLLAIIILPLVLGEDEPAEQNLRPLAQIEPSARNGYFAEYPEMVIDPSKEYEAVINTEKGELRLRLFADVAPLTVNNFVFLANQGFYDGLTFHRVMEDFMAQGGDPTGLGSGGPGYQFEDETANGLVFDRAGLLAMANAGANTNGSQFFITFQETPHLNGLHTIFGEVVDGQEVLDELTRIVPGDPSGYRGDVIERIEIVES